MPRSKEEKAVAAIVDMCESVAYSPHLFGSLLLQVNSPIVQRNMVKGFTTYLQFYKERGLSPWLTDILDPVAGQHAAKVDLTEFDNMRYTDNT